MLKSSPRFLKVVFVRTYLNRCFLLTLPMIGSKCSRLWLA